ncbi:T9SS type A sorting domain-containing protein [Prolixibacteraceae bacterium Z1-6]|uniref:T9SS type A sorting domain-containing protein n=1 Tax=Draconibacterium aestuarii TaxID=2998507 RepID=A0A9X3F616_9BACT|nr:T9SS type A sorting domain-containing protein [Prolixibacteraceae bacterium Z1-6]
MKKLLLFILIFSAIPIVVNAQERVYKRGVKISHPVCYASGKVEKARIPPPKDFLLKSGENATSNIDVTYIGFTEEAKKAFAYAVSIWEGLIESDMPIRMKAVWSSSLDRNVLGSCGPETYYTDFKDIPVEGRYYPVAIAEKIAKQELNGESRYDMVANFNKNIEWYFGIDMECPDDKYDFVSVVLHEITHGLGFTGFFDVDDNLGYYGFYEYGDATSFDELVHDSVSRQLVNTSFYDNLSTGLKTVLESSNLVAKSPVASKRNNGNYPSLYAPGSFDSGSSVYHLNDATYPFGNDNSLMTHAVGKAEAIHDPGPLSLGIMDDIGWRNIFIRFEPPKDIEEIKPISFDIFLESDYEIDSRTLKVIYSTDGFTSHTDTLLLGAAETGGYYNAFIIPESGIDSISYYIQAGDVMGRLKTAPTSAPKKFYSVNIGPDNEKPVISHTLPAYFLLRGLPMSITVQANDNFGIDTVYVEYSINGVEQLPFGLSKDANNYYSGVFTADIATLSDGDKVEYVIFAQDSSAAQNSSRLPLAEERFNFTIQEIFDPVSSYSNDYNQVNSDFVLSDFSVYTATDFANGALHSAHPYTSPEDDNKEFNFTTFLKYPIILKEEGTMSFDEVVLVEPGEAFSKYGDDDFWDYVIVEGSKDHGETWKEITDGYDSGAETLWKVSYNADIVDQVSQTAGTSEMFFNREIDLFEKDNFAVGDTVLIRFRIYSDPYASGWGWAIDNLIIQQPTATSNKTLAGGKVKVYPNPFNNSIMIDMDTFDKTTDIQIEVYDMFGREVHSQLQKDVFGGLKESIDLAHLNKGMFLIKISENGKTLLSKKLVKN